MNGTGDILVIKGSIVSSVLDSVKSKVLTGKKSDNLYLIVETFGGAAEIGFRIMRLLNSKYKTITVIVPDRAMSTGTLMALGGDKVYMFYSSCLGPLDVQIDHPSDGSRISTIDVRDTWTTISAISRAIARTTYNQAVFEYGLSNKEGAQLAYEHSTAFVAPIIDKIDPYHLHSSYRTSEVSAKYAKVLLLNRMMRGRSQVAETVSRKLANDYDTHGYSITLEEARDVLGLTVEDIAQLKDWPEIEVDYNLAANGVQLSYLKSKQTAKAPRTPTTSKGKP